MFLSYTYRDELLAAMGEAKSPKLAVNVPTCDDMGDPARITIHSIWWGSMSALKVYC